MVLASFFIRVFMEGILKFYTAVRVGNRMKPIVLHTEKCNRDEAEKISRAFAANNDTFKISAEWQAFPESIFIRRDAICK